MAEILVRGIPEQTIAEIDRCAREGGITRNEYLLQLLDREFRPQVMVTDDDLSRLRRLASDVTEPDVMRQAWR